MPYKPVAEMTPQEEAIYRAKKAEYRQKKAAQKNQSSLPLSQNTSSSQSESATVLHVADASSERTPRQPGRNEKQYQKLLDDYLGPLSGMLILVLCLFIYRFPMETSEQLADHLAMNQDELDLVIPPLASFLDKQNFSAETRQRILQSGDMIGLALGFGSYGTRVLGTLRDIQQGGVHVQSRGNAGGQTAQNNGVYNGVDWGGNGLGQFAQFATD